MASPQSIAPASSNPLLSSLHFFSMLPSQANMPGRQTASLHMPRFALQRAALGHCMSGIKLIASAAQTSRFASWQRCSSFAMQTGQRPIAKPAWHNRADMHISCDFSVPSLLHSNIWP
jgi:hypothetical protein